jgi:hypothetical protein
VAVRFTGNRWVGGEPLSEGPGFLPVQYTDAPFPTRTGGGNNNPLVNPLAKPGQQTTPFSNPYETGFSSGDIDWGKVAQVGCGFINNATARALCIAVTGGVSGGDPRGGSNNPLDQQPGTSMTCPPGYTRDQKTGGCKIIGVGSYIPGDIGKPDFVWTPIAGRYGIGVTPVAVQQQRRICPKRHVLGDDGICYKGIPRRDRAWDPGAKPMLTGGDLNAMRRTRKLQKTLAKAQRIYGKKTCSCKTGPARARRRK